MLPELHTTIPGPKSLALAADLRVYECQNVTYLAEDWPIFWQRAEGTNVWDEDGNRFLDMTSAFGVAGLGHTAEAVCEAMQQQAGILLHGMGDVHPTALKIEVCRRLSELTFERWGGDREKGRGRGVGKTVLSNSGFEAVETALKTALVATGRKGILSFEGGYHGLGYGALMGIGMEKFRDPFDAQLAPVRTGLLFPTTDEQFVKMQQQLDAVDASQFGAVLVEPIQGRGGKKIPVDGFLTFLRSWCDTHGALLIFDEIYTGFHRTGQLFACDWWGVVPDLLCLGKALSGGYPISACVGRVEVMDKWPVSKGEALHTSTFLGNPVGCAMACKALEIHADGALAQQVRKMGEFFLQKLKNIDDERIYEVRGRGLMIGVELREKGAPAGALAGKLLGELLAEGIVMLVDGEAGNVLALTPPFIITEEEIEHVVSVLTKLLAAS